MRVNVVLVFFISFWHRMSECGVLERRKRSLVDLREMVKITTGRNGTDFIPYGNWCGIGGSGKPVDQIDNCCRQHDLCYIEKLGKECNSIFSLYVANYKWKTEEGKIICSNEDGNPCDKATCVCDKEVVLCLAEHIDDYREEHRYVSSVLKS